MAVALRKRMNLGLAVGYFRRQRLINSVNILGEEVERGVGRAMSGNEILPEKLTAMIGEQLIKRLTLDLYSDRRIVFRIKVDFDWDEHEFQLSVSDEDEGDNSPARTSADFYRDLGDMLRQASQHTRINESNWVVTYADAAIAKHGKEELRRRCGTCEMSAAKKAHWNSFRAEQSIGMRDEDLSEMRSGVARGRSSRRC